MLNSRLVIKSVQCYIQINWSECWNTDLITRTVASQHVDEVEPLARRHCFLTLKVSRAGAQPIPRPRYQILYINRRGFIGARKRLLGVL